MSMIRKQANTMGDMDPNITKEKFDAMTAELQKLKDSWPELAKEVSRLAEMGDFSENAAYQMAKGKLRGVNWRILEVEDFLKRAVVIELPKNTGIVQLGSLVTIEIGGVERSYRILGSAETDPLKNVISQNSPVGSALLNHKAGDTVIVHLESGDKSFKIVRIE